MQHGTCGMFVFQMGYGSSAITYNMRICSVTNFNNPNILGSEPLFWCPWAIGLIYTSGGVDDPFHSHCCGHFWRSYSSISHP
jgi:hypothetical protein